MTGFENMLQESAKIASLNVCLRQHRFCGAYNVYGPLRDHAITSRRPFPNFDIDAESRIVPGNCCSDVRIIKTAQWAVSRSTIVETQNQLSKSHTFTLPAVLAVMILRSSNAIVPRKPNGEESLHSGEEEEDVIARVSGVTSVPHPFSRSHTHTLPSTPRLTHRPSASASALTGPVCPTRFRTKVSFGCAHAPARSGGEERR